jgi:hypothetical protein
MFSMVSALFGLRGEAEADSNSNGANVVITGIVCQDNLVKYGAASHASPDVYLDHAMSGNQKQQLLQYQAAPDSFQTSLHIAAGFHSVLLVTTCGGAVALIDVLPGHTRRIIVDICDSLLHSDSYRTLAIALPAAGIAPYIMQREGSRDETIQMTVEDGVAYAAALGEGKIIVIVPYPPGLPLCNFTIEAGEGNWREQHLRYNLSLQGLSRSNVPGKCGALDPLQL